jgi:hypothetical protein
MQRRCFFLRALHSSLGGSTVYHETKAALEQQTPAEKVKLLLFVFCSWFSILSRLLQFPVLNAMVELLVKVIQFQEKQKLPCSLGTLETVRLHVERRDIHGQLIRSVTLCNAWDSTDSRPGGKKSSPFALAQGGKLPPVVGVLISDVQALHPLIWLLYLFLLQLLISEEIEVHIIATQEPMLKGNPLVSKLYTEFTERGRWIQLDLSPVTKKKETKKDREKRASQRTTARKVVKAKHHHASLLIQQ